MHPVSSMASLSRQPLDRHAAILCDLDGCLISGDRVYDGARAFAARNEDRLWIVSNNSADTAETLSARLHRLALPIAPERIVLAGEQTLRRLALAHPGAAIAMHAEAPLVALAHDLGLVVGESAPACILLARQTRFDLNSLGRLVAQLESGAPLHVANLDRTHPGPDGYPVPETGALLAALRACRPDVAFRSIGKPAPDLIDIALERAGATRGDALFIGDNPETDGLAARAAGVAFIHIEAPGALPASDGRATC
ncbi:HAD-IIA family hydrolase [Nitratireductor pacificus]|uniref:Haloacid dehalogenase n=1 Tax=Nitratireductor pacificus pht-3B TaxID=391937 RepID=K2M8N0_9HYPH|nr:HAD family hydrolase [Nitratireductor pacificus]EKF17350.1 haloacid dehalogenase [Nitratireductor pacificus pht-3B]